MPPQTTAPILKLLQGPGVWAQEGLGSPPPRPGVGGASGKRNPSGPALPPVEDPESGGELGLLGPPPCWVGNALEVS